MVACDLWIADFLWDNKRTFGGYEWPAGYNLPWRVWVWGNSSTRNQIWGYPRCHIVIMGMGLGSLYLMGIYQLPSWHAAVRGEIETAGRARGWEHAIVKTSERSATMYCCFLCLPCTHQTSSQQNSYILHYFGCVYFVKFFCLWLL
jgi:hypothetical protein